MVQAASNGSGHVVELRVASPAAARAMGHADDLPDGADFFCSLFVSFQLSQLQIVKIIALCPLGRRSLIAGEANLMFEPSPWDFSY